MIGSPQILFAHLFKIKIYNYRANEQKKLSNIAVEGYFTFGK
jgi:hypothetical protein